MNKLKLLTNIMNELFLLLPVTSWFPGNFEVIPIYRREKIAEVINIFFISFEGRWALN
jgi:hypothetical protein